MINDWPQMKAFALSLGLPKVEETTSWGNEVLKAHEKLWVWWSPYVEAALFKCDKEERDMLRAADPETFIYHKHYESHNLILVAAGRIDEGWAEARLRSVWRGQAPKRFLKAWEDGNF
ncbi:MmcQ/YjbR family DNA-binding protein [Planktotalea sp.]|uniref:MmcQ/YjbR family DNA-binding protein n=1 Tax=Planktotalea sp. TaxID=2029877 RepID=UPI003D6C5180